MPILSIAFNKQRISKNGYQEHLASRGEGTFVCPSVCPSVCPNVCLHVCTMFEKVRKHQFQALPLTSFNSHIYPKIVIRSIKHLKKRVCPPLHWSVHPSVCLFVQMFVHALFEKVRKCQFQALPLTSFNLQGISKNGYQEHLASQEEDVTAPSSVCPSICLSTCPNVCLGHA